MLKAAVLFCSADPLLSTQGNSGTAGHHHSAAQSQCMVDPMQGSGLLPLAADGAPQGFKATRAPAATGGPLPVAAHD